MKAEYAIVVAGGGVIGACAAALLQRHARLAGGEVLLVERGLPSAPAPTEGLDLRVSALSRASERILAAAGAWETLDAARIARYERMRVWTAGVDPRADAALCFDAAEIAEPDLGCIAENRALQAALLTAGTQLGVAQLEARIERLSADADGTTLHTSAGEVRAQLLVIADGADSPLRQQLGIEVEQRAYGQRAIVARLASERPHESTAWQCFLSTGPVALLPLADGRVSLVWSALEERATQLLALDAADFEAELGAVMSPALGRFTLQGERASFPLRRQCATRWYSGSCVLVGDAAHTLHPLAGQGLNQGLLDVAALADALARRPARESVAAGRTLRGYQRDRRSAYSLVAALVDAFDRLFTSPSMPLRMLGRTALAGAAHSRALRSGLMRQAMGLAGPLPPLAR
jgi:ubiquinone biosynthesis UbiH/UbiF/VisC/COQ6 family hydroxylase